jgi:hypothetical protein
MTFGTKGTLPLPYASEGALLLNVDHFDFFVIGQLFILECGPELCLVPTAFVGKWPPPVPISLLYPRGFPGLSRQTQQRRPLRASTAMGLSSFLVAKL